MKKPISKKKSDCIIPIRDVYETYFRELQRMKSEGILEGDFHGERISVSKEITRLKKHLATLDKRGT